MKESDIKQKIIGFLDGKSPGFVSGEKMSRLMGFSRANVWKYINKLRQDGYGIDASTHLGYRLNSAPDRLYTHEIKRGLTTSVIGKRDIFYYDTVPSTNAVAYAMAENNAPEGTLVVAESQTEGKGRMDRKWVSPRGGIYMSVVLRPDSGADDMQSLTLASACAVARAVKDFSGASPEVKWPNDLILGGKKLCGILTEMRAELDGVRFLVMGIGVNVNDDNGQLPPEAVSLGGYLGKRLRRPDLIKEILCQIERVYTVFMEKGFSSLRTECKKISMVMKKTVKVVDHDRIIEGTVKDIDEKGALIVRDTEGNMIRVLSGQIFLAG